MSEPHSSGRRAGYSLRLSYWGPGLPVDLSMLFQLRDHQFDFARQPAVMGILNVTPDSFSDGGRFLDPEKAVARGLEMIREGASIIDVGPESTRPGASPISAEEQADRAIEVIARLREKDSKTVISIDTRSAAVAEAALASGADLINDVSAMRDDPRMVAVAASTGVPVVLMHRRGDAQTMQEGGGPQYDDVVAEILEFLRERIDWAMGKGVRAERIIVDPGIGFGKRSEHNLAILGATARFAKLGFPVLVGASRKRFLGGLLEPSRRGAAVVANDRLAGSLACAAIAVLSGAAILRVHDVRETVELVRTCAAVRAASV